jgi:hypothetical protein
VERKLIADAQAAITHQNQEKAAKKRTLKNETQQLIQKAVDRQQVERKRKAEEKARDAKLGNTFLLCLQKRQERI